ncbi:arylesterase [Rubrivirga sp.]|uniref:arylesterase n=1 Tax=Rubrivirga sp. TaxID=1885344 RepID=UPI003C75DE6A
MRLAFAVSLLALSMTGCQDAPSDPPTALEDAAVPGATATPESRTTPDLPLADADEDAVTVVFFGDSLTAGYGLESQSLAYPALVGADLEAAGVPVRVVNAGVSGETSAGGRSRIDWTLANSPPDVFVLALGANDGLRGTSVDAMRDNLSAILEAVKDAAPDARLVVAGMEALPNYGAEYTAAFRDVFPAVAQEHGAAFVPFLLEGVAGDASLNQSDGVHPTAQGQRIMAETVLEVVEPLVLDDAS